MFTAGESQTLPARFVLSAQEYVYSQNTTFSQIFPDKARHEHLEISASGACDESKVEFHAIAIPGCFEQQGISAIHPT